MNLERKKPWNYEKDYADELYRIYLWSIKEAYDKMNYVDVIKITRGYIIINELLRRQNSN